MEFKKAVRRSAKARLALSGPSGSGKTWSALLVAGGLGGKVGELRAGLPADFVLWEISEPAALCYWLGATPPREVFIAGKPIPPR